MGRRVIRGRLLPDGLPFSGRETAPGMGACDPQPTWGEPRQTLSPGRPDRRLAIEAMVQV